jgi:hypothetical protein
MKSLSGKGERTVMLRFNSSNALTHQQKTRIEVSIRVFANDFCHSERSEESRTLFAAALE